mmetsp:Transcript_147465/g.473741  ORF Transcript_147465/g.473741 Transcript_147465/m.473741 type:complete len:252 (+) Transcript_147465:71-826(+)
MSTSREAATTVVAAVARPDARRSAYDLISKRCYWTGDWGRDYTYHVANWHPLLSICFCDRCNPYHGLERLAVFVIVCTLSILPAAAMTQACFAIKLDQRCHVGDKLATLVFVTLPVMILQYVIEYMIYLRAVLKYKKTIAPGRLGGCCGCLENCMNCASGCFLCASFYVVGIVLLLAGWVVAVGGAARLQELVKPLLVSRVECWLLWFITDLYMPCIGFVAKWRAEAKDLATGRIGESNLREAFVVDTAGV